MLLMLIGTSNRRGPLDISCHIAAWNEVQQDVPVTDSSRLAGQHSSFETTACILRDTRCICTRSIAHELDVPHDVIV